MHVTSMTQLTCRHANAKAEVIAAEALREEANCVVLNQATTASTVQADGSLQQHWLPAQSTKAGQRFPNLHSPSISSRKSENGENRTRGNPSVLGKLVFLFYRNSRSSWPKRLAASVGRLYKWKPFREIGRQLLRVILCKSVVCCNIWTGDTFYSNLFASRYR